MSCSFPLGMKYINVQQLTKELKPLDCLQLMLNETLLASAMHANPQSNLFLAKETTIFVVDKERLNDGMKLP